jgi:SOS-response transcriptional repressor LexA
MSMPKIAEVPILDTIREKRPAVPLSGEPGVMFWVNADWMDRTGAEVISPVRGDCMAPAGINDGDLAGIKLQSTAQDGDIAVVRTPRELLVKMYMRLDGREYLIAADISYPLILMDDTMTIEGVVVGVTQFTD